MTARALTRLVGAGAGPRRLRDELGRATTALRAAARVSNGVRGLGATIPSSVLGAELADVLGDRLRRALRFWDGEPVVEPADVPARDVRPGTPVRAAAADTAERASQAGAPHVARRVWSGSEASANTRDVRESDAGQRETPRSRTPLTPSRERAVEGVAVWADARSGSARRSSATTAASTPAPETPPMTSTPLAAALRAYWSSARDVAPPHGAREQTTDAPARARSGRDAPAPPSHEQDSARAWPAPFAVHSSPAFVSSAARDGAPRPRVAGAILDPARPFALRDAPFHGGDPDWAASDLADQLADILRGQAMDHGVELT